MNHNSKARWIGIKEAMELTGKSRSTVKRWAVANEESGRAKKTDGDVWLFSETAITTDLGLSKRAIEQQKEAAEVATNYVVESKELTNSQLLKEQFDQANKREAIQRKWFIIAIASIIIIAAFICERVTQMARSSSEAQVKLQNESYTSKLQSLEAQAQVQMTSIRAKHSQEAQSLKSKIGKLENQVRTLKNQLNEANEPRQRPLLILDGYNQ